MSAETDVKAELKRRSSLGLEKVENEKQNDREILPDTVFTTKPRTSNNTSSTSVAELSAIEVSSDDSDKTGSRKRDSPDTVTDYTAVLPHRAQKHADRPIRSRMGCYTCRRRKKRCDECRPVCLTCKRLHLDCHYPLPGLERKNLRHKQFPTKRRASDEAATLSAVPNQILRQNVISVPISNVSDQNSTTLGLIATSSTNSATSMVSAPPANDPNQSPEPPSSQKQLQQKHFVESNSNAEISAQEPQIANGPFPAISLAYTNADGVASNEKQNETRPIHQFPVSNTGIAHIVPTSTSALSPVGIDREQLRRAPLPADLTESTSSVAPVPVDAFSLGATGHGVLASIDLNRGTPLVGDRSFWTPAPEYGQESPLFFLNSSDTMHSDLENGSFRPSAFSSLDLADPFAAVDIMLQQPLMPTTSEDRTAGAINLARSPQRPLEPSVGETIHGPTGGALVGSSTRAPGLDEVDHAASTDKKSIKELLSTEVLKAAFPDLDQDGLRLFEYYRDIQSSLLSVSPLNYFRTVFVAMAMRSRAVLYAVLTWAAAHCGNESAVKKYAALTTELVKIKPLDTLSKEEILAALLVLASAKICFGDLNDWRNHLSWASEVIQRNGGILSFMQSESVRWLLKNFAYKEILTSSYTRAPAVFSLLEFEYIFSLPSGSRLPDTLCACCEPIFLQLALIHELAREVHDLVDRSQGDTADINVDALQRIYQFAVHLESKIWQMTPDSDVLDNLGEEDRSLQVALFELFQLVAVLHMYQVVLRINASALQVRYIDLRLIRALSEVLGTNVEGILTFPLFIAGVCCADTNGRQQILDMFEGFLNRMQAGNIRQAQNILQEVWKEDDGGTRYIDWNNLVFQRGIYISFV